MFKVGDKVRYSPIIGRPHDGKVYTVSHGPQEVCGTMCYWLAEKSGAVAAAALSTFVAEASKP